MSYDEFTEQVLEDVESCIGCNDCMLACPIQETALVSIAQLNAAVMQPVVNDPAVELFVTACTQCQQCVPACPADLSRANMVLYNKHKVEDVVPDHALNAQAGEHVVPSGWTLDQLVDHVSHVSLLGQIRREDVRRLVLSSTLVSLSPNEVLLHEGDYQERLLVVVQGRLSQFADTVRGRVHLIEVGPGFVLGEMAVLADRPEPYSIEALEVAQVLAIPKATVRRVMGTSDELKTVLDQLHAERGVATYVGRSLVLGQLPVTARERLLRSARRRTYRPGDVLLRQGDGATSYTMVLAGFLEVSHAIGDQERILVYHREGDEFGALTALQPGRRSQAKVRAISTAHVLEIPARELQKVMSEHPDVRRSVLALADREANDGGYMGKPVYAGDTKTGYAARNTTELGLDVAALHAKGLMKGHQILAIDQTLCTDCNNCVDACTRRHGRPRMERRGLQLDHLLFPQACRHCDDPVCLLCSVNGIVREPTGEIRIVEDTCIGCGGCASRCPYGNISMHPVDKARKTPFDWLANLLSPSSSEGRQPFFDLTVNWMRSRDRSDDTGQKVAVKCDLCADYQDQACVKACPTGAAFRMDPIEAFGDESDEPVHLGLRARGDKHGA
ncbi:MAG: Fe-S-cluster-containing hydrogenase component 2/CRP-like cAMP-binding protein [Kiritimatiellia bacterium]|jgi:Fe-S-cluster-containing hydrogenase component 2/CRP-like cAMP-binding protein